MSLGLFLAVIALVDHRLGGDRARCGPASDRDGLRGRGGRCLLALRVGEVPAMDLRLLPDRASAGGRRWSSCIGVVGARSDADAVGARTSSGTRCSSLVAFPVIALILLSGGNFDVA